MAACRMLVRLVSTETGRSRPGVERNGHQCHRETARAAVRQAAGKAEVSTMEKALNKALDRLRGPDATLVLRQRGQLRHRPRVFHHARRPSRHGPDRTANYSSMMMCSPLPGHPQSWKLGN